MTRKKFDASIKDLLEARAVDLAVLFGGCQVRNVRLLDPEVSTVSGAADKAMMIGSGRLRWVLHLEFLSGRDLEAPFKTWWYNSILHQRHRCRVRSVMVLLRPAADGRDLTGIYSQQFPEDGEPYTLLRYRVIRLWKIPVEQLLGGGIGLLPLAPLADDASQGLPQVIERIDRRLKAETSGNEADKLRAATTILMGLRHSPALVHQVLQGATPMWDKIIQDSSIVREYVKRGEERGEKRGEKRGQLLQARRQLLRLGQAKFGRPTPTVVAAIEAIERPDRLEKLAVRLLKADSWDDLLPS